MYQVFLVLPSQLTAVMANEDLAWKFQFMQFQFDMNLFFLFFSAILLGVWLVISLTSLIIVIVKRFSRGTMESD